MQNNLLINIQNELLKNKEYKHIIIRITNDDIKEDIIDILLYNIIQEDKNPLLLDLSKRGENNRGFGIEGKGTISKKDIDESNTIIANGFGISSVEECITRFTITTGHKKSFLLINTQIKLEDIIMENPLLKTLCPLLEIYIDDEDKIRYTKCINCE